MKNCLSFLVLIFASSVLSAQTYNVKGKDANNVEVSSEINFTTSTPKQIVLGGNSTDGSENASVFVPRNLKIRSFSYQNIYIPPYIPASTNGFLFRVERYFDPGPGFTPYTIPDFNINSHGIVGIGTVDSDGLGVSADSKKYRLYVKDGIRAEHIKVDLKPSTVWYDHVFQANYKLMSFAELEAYISQNKHLPDVPSEAEVRANGVDLVEMDAILLKKVEELTLYMLQLQKQNQELQKQIDELKKIQK